MMAGGTAKLQLSKSAPGLVSLVGFSLIPKYITVNGFEWLFHVKFYIRTGTIHMNIHVYGRCVMRRRLRLSKIIA